MSQEDQEFVVFEFEEDATLITKNNDDESSSEAETKSQESDQTAYTSSASQPILVTHTRKLPSKESSPKEIYPELSFKEPSPFFSKSKGNAATSYETYFKSQIKSDESIGSLPVKKRF